MKNSSPEKKWFFSPSVLERLSAFQLREAAGQLSEAGARSDNGVVVATASEVLEFQGFPAWMEQHTTKFVVLLDVPEEAFILLPSELNIRVPAHRLYASRDAYTLRRLVVSQYRDRPMEGIVDAFLLLRELVVIGGDLELRRFPVGDISPLHGLEREELQAFTIDDDGSYLFWESRDIHLGLSELLMETDVSYRVEREIERNRQDHIPRALSCMRRQRGLRQSDIAGLSDRQVRRLETGESQLTTEAVGKIAGSLGLEVEDFLEELSKLCAEADQRSAQQSWEPTKEQSVA